MSKLSRPGMYVTPRDKLLFSYLFLNKIATGAQINRDVFGVSDLGNVLRRMRTLIRHGYVRRKPIGEAVAKFGYFVTEKTFDLYLKRRTSRPWTQLKSESPDHDIALVDIRHRLSRGPYIANYFTENAIEAGIVHDPDFPTEAFLEMHSDAGFGFLSNDRTWHIAVEYEDEQKSTDRYISHFNSYYLQPRVHGVLYIVKEPRLISVLAKVDTQFCKEESSKIFLGTLADVLDAKRKLHFSNNMGNILQLDEVQNGQD